MILGSQVGPVGHLGNIVQMKKSLKGINICRKKDEDGNIIAIYVYAWKGGPRLYAPLDSDEIIIEFAEAFKQKTKKPKNLGVLLDGFTKSRRFNKNKPLTISKDLSKIRRIKTKLGELPISVFDDVEAIDLLEDWRDSVAERAPASAEAQFVLLSTALDWAAERNFIKRNPCKGHMVAYNGTRVDKIWSDEQVERYIKLAPSHMVIALMLALWTGQREGSLVKLCWSAYDGNILTVVQEKNRNGTPPKIVKIPVKGEFKTFMDNLERQAGVVDLSQDERDKRYILLNARGWNWKANSFCCVFGRITRDVVKIEDRTFHDLRGTAVTKLFLAGCTDAEIATITGHSLKNVRAILDKHYFHRDIKLAERAMDKRLALEGDVLSAQLALAAQKAGFPDDTEA